MTTKDKLIEKMEEFIYLSDAIIGAIDNADIDELIGKRINVRLEISSLKSEVEKESEQVKKKRLIYHLNCDKCGDAYWCGEGFPDIQLCKKCEESEQFKNK